MDGSSRSRCKRPPKPPRVLERFGEMVLEVSGEELRRREKSPVLVGGGGGAGSSFLPKIGMLIDCNGSWSQGNVFFKVMILREDNVREPRE